MDIVVIDFREVPIAQNFVVLRIWTTDLEIYKKVDVNHKDNVSILIVLVGKMNEDTVNFLKSKRIEA